MLERDTIVVIRSIGERTLDLCEELVSRQISRNNIVHVKNEKPQQIAVKKTFEAALNSNKKWLIVIGADVLLFENALSKLVKNATKLPKHFFCSEGLILDKLSMRYRPAGHHLYRVSLLEEALSLLSTSENIGLRGDTFTREQMEKRGYLFERHKDIYGLHDFEQHFFDIYRTCFLHAHKHKNLISSFMVNWAKHLEEDLDFLVAFKGLSDGILYKKNIINSPDFFYPFYERFKLEYSLVEKETLKISQHQTQKFVSDLKLWFESKMLPQHNQKFAYQFCIRSDKKNHYEVSDLIPMIQWKLSRLFNKLEKVILR